MAADEFRGFFYFRVKNMRALLFLFLSIVTLYACDTEVQTAEKELDPVKLEGIELIVLGIAQDAGFPQTACEKDCCKALLQKGDNGALITSLGLVDHTNNTRYMFEASPDFPEQLAKLNARHLGEPGVCDGIFITHAHMGHYTGLMYLGRESVGASKVPVYCMPRMKTYLTNNGPWSQLVNLENINIQELERNRIINLDTNLRVEAIEVPHRDEFSETVGFRITGPEQSALFIPDIDKWSRWDLDIKEEVSKVDYAFLDATFYSNGEIPGRDMSEIPHPFVEETMDLFSNTSIELRKKIYFIHLNHTNPLLRGGDALREINEKGFNIAREGAVFRL